MALDDHLLHAIRPGEEPILHIWRWDRPAISIGYGQSLDSALLNRIEAAGLPVVRRPTGGKAVLHGTDISYACVVPRPYRDWDEGSGPPYEFVARAVASALRRSGLPCGPPSESMRAELSGNGVSCGAEIYPHELAAAGGKVLGSAQKRVRTGILVQGTISPLGPAELASLFDPGSATAGAPSPLNLQQVVDAFRREHSIRFEPLALGRGATRSIAKLVVERYRSGDSPRQLLKE